MRRLFFEATIMTLTLAAGLTCVAAVVGAAPAPPKFSNLPALTRMCDEDPARVIAAVEAVVTQEQATAIEAAVLTPVSDTEKLSALRTAEYELQRAGELAAVDTVRAKREALEESLKPVEAETVGEVAEAVR